VTFVKTNIQSAVKQFF